MYEAVRICTRVFRNIKAAAKVELDEIIENHPLKAELSVASGIVFGY